MIDYFFLQVSRIVRNNLSEFQYKNNFRNNTINNQCFNFTSLLFVIDNSYVNQACMGYKKYNYFFYDILNKECLYFLNSITNIYKCTKIKKLLDINEKKIILHR